ncbi:MAG TPA: tetratricopeptide repeat protein [Candidatus Omnitrophota bacterium]|nr:tetratricopeptide repeat protein [Candidatus Omnitrophota bacterium]HPS36229.1 tetratricopeptide repeat protein [Candidatus Omnitrophota bacterium]
MRRSWLIVLFFLSLASCLFPRALSAEIVQLKNGNAIETKILKETEEFVVVEAPGGKVKIPKKDIQTIWRGTKEQLVEVRGKEVYFAKGVELYKEGKFREAADSFEQARGPSAMNAVIYANLGSAYASAGEAQKAEANFLKALETKPGDPDALLNVARFYEVTRRFAQAEGYYEKALLLRPQDRKIKKGLAYCYFNLGAMRKAAGLYEEMGRGNDVVNSLNAAICYLFLGEVERAEPLTDEVFKKDVFPPRAYLVRAEIYKRKNRFAEAEADYRRFLKIQPNDKGALTGLGFLYLDMNDYGKAEGQFRQVLSADPGNAIAGYGLTQVYILSKTFDKAEDYYRNAAARDPGNLILMDRWGLLYLKMNEPQKALEIYRKLVGKDDRYANGHANLGLAYAMMNDADNALKEWNRALELNPSLKEAAQNKKLLEDAMKGNSDAGKQKP